MPNSSALTATSRSIAKPNVIGSPFARTTRMPDRHAPERLAVRARHHQRRVEQRDDRERDDREEHARRSATTMPASSEAKKPTENTEPKSARMSERADADDDAVDQRRADARPPARERVAAARRAPGRRARRTRRAAAATCSRPRSRRAPAATAPARSRAARTRAAAPPARGPAGRRRSGQGRAGCVAHARERYRQRSTRSASGTSRTTRAGTPMTTARGGHVARHDRAGGHERLLADLDARAEHRAAADPARAPQPRAAQRVLRAVARHRVVVRRARAGADEHVVLHHGERGQVDVGLHRARARR